MKIGYKLIHQDGNGQKTTTLETISFLAFVKHATFAGISNGFSPGMLFRYASQFFDFYPSFWGPANHFWTLHELSFDPTERAFLSNRIGRAFADYLSKKLYKARYTHCYETAMLLKGLPIVGKRPDFFCDATTKQFAVEAKGYSSRSISDQSMKKHKAQSQTGGIKVNFTTASVAYNLYRSAIVKYYDPDGENVPYDTILNAKLRHWYYSNALSLIEAITNHREQSELPDFLAFNVNFPSIHFPRILIHKAIYERSWENIEGLTSLEEINVSNNSEFYIDVDGIGLTYTVRKKRQRLKLAFL